MKLIFFFFYVSNIQHDRRRRRHRRIRIANCPFKFLCQTKTIITSLCSDCMHSKHISSARTSTRLYWSKKKKKNEQCAKDERNNGKIAILLLVFWLGRARAVCWIVAQASAFSAALLMRFFVRNSPSCICHCLLRACILYLSIVIRMLPAIKLCAFVGCIKSRLFAWKLILYTLAAHKVNTINKQINKQTKGETWSCVFAFNVQKNELRSSSNWIENYLHKIHSVSSDDVNRFVGEWVDKTDTIQVNRIVVRH